MQNKSSETTRHHFRSLAQLDLIDNFLFQATISQGEAGEEVCRILLRTILGRPFGKIRVVPQKPFLGPDVDRHGIRLDAYIEDWTALSSDTPDVKKPLQTDQILDAELCPDIYDIEPNKTSEKAMLPKRMRYYHGLIDSHLLDSGKTYDTLPSVFIITILPYDPFGQNRMVYTIKNCCVEVPELPYDDGAVKIFLYTKGTEGNPGKELRDMLKYIEETTEQNITNPDIAAIHEAVSQAKQSREVGINYMKSWEWEDMIRKEATAEGLAEGREKGLAEGLAEGREKGLAEGREVGLVEGREKGLAEGREKGLAEGREVGLAEGQKKATRHFVEGLLKRGFSDEEILSLTGCDITLIDEIRKE